MAFRMLRSIHGISEAEPIAPLAFCGLCCWDLGSRSYDRTMETQHINTAKRRPWLPQREERGARLLLCRGRHPSGELEGRYDIDTAETDRKTDKSGYGPGWLWRPGTPPLEKEHAHATLNSQRTRRLARPGPKHSPYGRRSCVPPNRKCEKDPRPAEKVAQMCKKSAFSTCTYINEYPGIRSLVSGIESFIRRSALTINLMRVLLYTGSSRLSLCRNDQTTKRACPMKRVAVLPQVPGWLIGWCCCTGSLRILQGGASPWQANARLRLSVCP